jgi:adenosylcobyric acid synthase
MGICGGFQILGKHITDSLGIEGKVGTSDGLALLDVDTELLPEKQLTNVTGVLSLEGTRVTVSGYEIHAGQSTVLSQALIELSVGTKDGAISEDNQVIGTYLHGILDSSEFVSLLVRWVNGESVSSYSINDEKEQALDTIADALENHLDLQQLWPDLGFTN